MQNGKLADAQLRALIDVAAVAAGAHRLEEVLELAAERSLEALGGSSLAISRWDMDSGVVRTLINVGDLAPGEERFPENETYSVKDYPAVVTVMREGGSSLAAVDDPESDPAQRDLLRRLGKESSLSVPMMLRGEPWGELWVTTAPGKPRMTSDDENFLRAIGDQLVGAIHRAELFDQIERLAYTDSLTGIASRRAVEMALEEACAAPRSGSPALVLCDIDNLKRVNDTGGHEAGDRALVAAANALLQAAAGYDDAVVGRFGGDEFCVLLPTATAEDARRLAENAVSRLDAATGGERISCGVSARSQLMESPAELLRAADEAQYRAKRLYGVDVVVAGDEPDAPPPFHGRDRAYRAGDPDAQLARELLALLDELNGASAEERLAKLRARLERRV